MIVTINGAAKDAQRTRAGIYVLGPTLVNDKPHWLQNQGSNAIWYNKRHGGWNIGNQAKLGGLRLYYKPQAKLYSPDDSYRAGPQEASTWKYYGGRRCCSINWIRSEGILIDTFVEPGTLRCQINECTRLALATFSS